MTKINQPGHLLARRAFLITLILVTGLAAWWLGGQIQQVVSDPLVASSSPLTTGALNYTAVPTTAAVPTVSPPPALSSVPTDCLAGAFAECSGALNFILTPGLTDLSGINLAGAKLSNLSLAGFDLSGANLTGASLSGNFSGTNFKSVSAEGVSLAGTFDRANFNAADLFGATLSGSFNGANFAQANLAEGSLDGDYKNTSFASTQLVAAFFKNANLTAASFAGVSNRTIVTFYLKTVICPDGSPSNPRYADLRACRL